MQAAPLTNYASLTSVTYGGCEPSDVCWVNIGPPSQFPPYEIDNGVGYAQGLFFTPEAQALAVVGDGACTTSSVNPAFYVDIQTCNDQEPPPVWLRFYDGPNQVTKGPSYQEISFEFPAPADGLPLIVNNQTLWEQMSILQPFPVFGDIGLISGQPTFCSFSSNVTVWNNGGFNFELTAGNLKVPTGDAPPVEPYNTLLPEDYLGWTAFSLMALGNGAGGAQAGFQLRLDQDTNPQPVKVKYTLDEEYQTVMLEIRYKQNVTKYLIPQEMFKQNFLPVVLESGYLSPDDKQVKEVEDFVWIWSLFTMIETIQKPVDPAGQIIRLDDLPKYWPMTSSYNNIRVKVRGYPGYNNLNAFNQTLNCAKGFELYGSLFDNLAFFGVEGTKFDLKYWLDNTAPKCDPRYAYWNCVYGIAKSREAECVRKLVNPQNAPWSITVGFLDGLYPQECNSLNPETASIMDGTKYGCGPGYRACPTNPCA